VRQAALRICRMRGPDGGWPEHPAGGTGGRSPPVWGSGVIPRETQFAGLTEDMLKPSTRSGGIAQRVK